MPLTHKQFSKLTHDELNQSKLTQADLSSGTLEILPILKDKEDIPPEIYEKFKQMFYDFKKDNPEIAKDLEAPTSYDKPKFANFLNALAALGAIRDVMAIIDYALKLFVK
ncbi:hypothetical protein [Peptostreptococcus equinus]|uniref:Phage XkdN-like tail assembly chaperone protein, TAC n=1 Tax=Peptostreptococcus equinus TaxID=3003601 RepID=A0ABY7JQK2_9FIRM|nr:hypothetical protein [Peptostreptococcus sp. CBA3647]WAW15424.1 hypothetical protein O0R46_02980 [Peptostreptococcus sp. CBA3647]